MSKEKSDLKWNYRIIKSTTKAFEDIPDQDYYSIYSYFIDIVRF